MRTGGRRALLAHALAAAGACTVLCALPSALADTAGPGTVNQGSAFTAAATPTVHATGSGGMRYPKPSSGPPRQFPLSPSPSKVAPPPPSSPPPVTHPASPSPAKAAPPPPGPSAVATTPKPSVKPTTPRPTPTPSLKIVLPPAAYHPLPHKRLSTVLVLFVVAIVPVSLARVRRR